MSIPDTANTRKALEYARQLGGKPVVVRPYEESPRKTDSFGQHFDTPQGHFVFVGGPVPEQTLIHELLHVILRKERFPDVRHSAGFVVPRGGEDYAAGVLDVFANTLDHQMVYRRMASDYTLDMAAYHRVVASRQLERTNTDPGLYADHTYVLTEVLLGLDHHLWGDEGQRVAARFRELNADAAGLSLNLHRELEGLGLSAPAGALRAGQIMRDQVVGYGEEHKVHADILRYWRALEAYAPDPTEPA